MPVTPPGPELMVDGGYDGMQVKRVHDVVEKTVYLAVDANAADSQPAASTTHSDPRIMGLSELL